MLPALADTGWHNYSLFLREDGLLIGYVETDDLAAAQAAWRATDVNARWQAEMAEFFEDLERRAPDAGSCSSTRSSTWRTSSQRTADAPAPATSRRMT